MQLLASTTVALASPMSNQNQSFLLKIMNLVLHHWKQDFRSIMRAHAVLGRGGFGTVFGFIHYKGKVTEPTPFVGKHLRKPPREFVRLRGKVKASQKREMVIQARCAAAGISIFPIALLHTNAKQEDGLMIMERLPPGSTITAFVKKHWRSAKQMTRIRTAIMRTVKTMHALGVVHGDLHGDNLWLCDKKDGEEDRVLVLDFGRSIVVPENVMNGVGKAMDLYVMSDDYAKEHIFVRWADASVYKALWVPSASNMQWEEAMQAMQGSDKEAFQRFPKYVRIGIDKFLNMYVSRLNELTKEEEESLLTMRTGDMELTIVARRCF